MFDLRGAAPRWAAGVAAVVAGTAVAVGVASPAQAAAPRCNAVDFMPYIHGGGGVLELPVYRSGGSITVLCTLSYGDSGDDVRQLQWILNYCYKKSLSVDGQFGPKTRTALMQAQDTENVKVDGIYGPQTAMAFKFPWIPNGGCKRL
ncbi:hypothetical protein GCM10009682_18230 [Luedemannella flava]|uniref:Peptidoglycan binding-like domain-containing protein n=1 Tax=Luedemannella flava TaxID=349316 RepID=A0ABN2LQV6_9ACTN